ncbi:DNA-binding protein [Pseudomonas aeruginosa]
MLALIGLCQGYYSDTRNVNTANGPSQIVEHSVLVQVEQTNKFGMPETKVVQVRISKRHMDGGLNNVWKMEKGKTVSVPVFIRPWASKSGNAGFDYWLSGDGMPLKLQAVQEKAA